MNIEDMLASVRGELALLGSEEGRKSTLRFFKEPVPCYGVSSPQLKAIEKRIAPEIRQWPSAQRNRFCVELLKAGMIEESNLVPYLYRRYTRQCGECEFKLFAKWMDRYVNNWATCDGISVWLIGETLLRYPSLAGELEPWAESKKRWVRRSAAVSLIPTARRGLANETILRQAERLIGDEDEMVQKGVGWLLKETYPKRPSQTVEFLVHHARRTTRLVLRYAAEKMTPEDRKLVLAN